MADNPATAPTPLLNQVKQLIMLSIGLKFAEKNELLGKLGTMNDEQLNELKGIFEAEKSRKDHIMKDFFAKHPELFPEYERLAQGRVNKIYSEVEAGEQEWVDSRMAELEQADF